MMASDDATRRRELESAEQIYRTMGAAPHAERVAQMLAESPG